MFCKHCGKQINEDAKFCKFCGSEIVLEEFSYTEPEYSFFKNINYRKLIFNRYVLILIGVAFVIWIYPGDDVSYSGTKAPLPTPIEQASDDVVKFIPTTPAVSLANGTILTKNNIYLGGNGELEIENGTDLDALAKLIRAGSSVLTVYIKANSTYTMFNISNGTYWLAFAHGLDFDSTNQQFRRNTEYSAFDSTFDFTRTEDSQYYYYSIFEVTLNSVIGGTATTSSVDPDQFNAY